MCASLVFMGFYGIFNDIAKLIRGERFGDVIKRAQFQGLSGGFRGGEPGKYHHDKTHFFTLYLAKEFHPPHTMHHQIRYDDVIFLVLDLIQSLLCRIRDVDFIIFIF